MRSIAYSSFKALVVCGGVLLAACTAPASNDFDAGYAAYQRGDFKAALDVWRPLAHSGHTLAQYNLGMMYADGRGLKQDHGRAIIWLRKAAEQNLPRAQYNLASLHLIGEAPDYAKARRWLARAADAGLDRAQHTLAKLYQYGLGTPIDHAAAHRYFQMAATQSHLPAMYNLGKLYRDGRGVAIDEGESLKWFRAAAELGYAKAQAKLGQRFATGRGVPKNAVEAYVWTALAARQGLLSASARVETLVARLSAPERAAAERRIVALEGNSQN